MHASCIESGRRDMDYGRLVYAEQLSLDVDLRCWQHRSPAPLTIVPIRSDVSTDSRNARWDVRISRRDENKAAGGGAQRRALLIAKQ